MTYDPMIADLLAEIAKDPKKLLEVLQKMDVDHDKRVTAGEVITWAVNNAKDIDVNGKNLSADVEAAKTSVANIQKSLQTTNIPAAYVEQQMHIETAKLQAELRTVAALVQKAAANAKETLATIQNDTGPAAKAPEVKDPLEEITTAYLMSVLEKHPKGKKLVALVKQQQAGEVVDDLEEQKRILKLIRSSNEEGASEIAEQLQALVRQDKKENRAQNKAERKETRDPNHEEIQAQHKTAEEERARIAQEQATLDPKTKALKATYETITKYSFDTIDAKELGKLVNNAVGAPVASEGKQR